MKKFLTVLLTLVVACSVVFAGGAEETADEGPVELEFWHYFSLPDGPAFEKRVEEFNKEFEGKIHVTPTFVPRDELVKQYSIGAVSGELPDMGMVDNPEHAAYASMGILEDLTSYYEAWDEANFLDGPMDSCIYDGKVWGLPQSSNCLALFYDVDALAAAGVEPPETWDDLLAAAEKLTDPAKGVYGLAMCAIGNEEGTFQFIPFLESAGAYDKLDSEGSIEALEMLTTLVKNGWMSKEVVNWTQADAEKQFASGNAAMMINGPWNIPAVDADAPGKNWDVCKVPRSVNGKHASCLGGENFVVCKGANVDACWTFLSWFCGKDVSLSYTTEIAKFSPRADIDGVEQFKAEPKMAAFSAVMPTARPRGPHPQWPEISAAIYTAMQESLTGLKDARTAMTEAQAKINDIVK